MTSLYDYVIVGMGPAGFGAALSILHNRPDSRLLCLDAGRAPEDRFCTVLEGKGCRQAEPCEIIGGLGGSAVLSGGKISTFPAGRSLAAFVDDPTNLAHLLESARMELAKYLPMEPPNTSRALQRAAVAEYEALGFEFRYYDAHRYRRQDIVRAFSSMTDEIRRRGAVVASSTRATFLRRDSSDGFVLGLEGAGTRSPCLTRNVVIAGGRSAHRLLDGGQSSLELGGVVNRTDVGVRLEFPSNLWPSIDQAHNDLKLQWGDARTYCVCKGGSVAPYRLDGVFLMEGSSDPSCPTGLTNLAVMVRWPESLFEDVKSKHRQMTGGLPVRQSLAGYLRGDPEPATDPRTSISYWRQGHISSLFPPAASTQIRKRVEEFASRFLPAESWSTISVYAPEMDYYWPQFPVERGFRTSVPGLYIVGDATGHFRGILQAFLSGLICGRGVGE